MEFEILTREELLKTPPDCLDALLCSFWNCVCEAVLRDDTVRNLVFAQRNEIAELLWQFGGRKFEWICNSLRGVVVPTDMLNLRQITPDHELENGELKVGDVFCSKLKERKLEGAVGIFVEFPDGSGAFIDASIIEDNAKGYWQLIQYGEDVLLEVTSVDERGVRISVRFPDDSDLEKIPTPEQTVAILNSLISGVEV